MKYYITGDCHRHFRKVEFFCRHHGTTREDVLILLGDVGINFFLDDSDKKLKEELSKLPITLFCVHGNHEERPEYIGPYYKKIWCGGAVSFEPQYSNILFAIDGEIYKFGKKKGIVIGGAYSVDREYRLLAGLPWFQSEQPSEKVKKRVEKELEKIGWKVDYVFSHTCPLLYEPTPKEVIGFEKIDRSTEEWLDSIAKKLQYTKWYFGHYHDNIQYADAELLYEGIKELGKEDYLQKLGRPKYRVGEKVYFLYGKEQEGYGTISVVDGYGTFGQAREVSYDIMGFDCNEPESRILFKHIEESKVQRFEEMLDESL